MTVNPGLPLAAAAEAAPQPEPRAEGPWVRNGLYFGKYKSMEEADKGHWELHQTLSQRQQELEAATARLAALEQATRDNPAPRGPWDEVADLGLDPRALRAAVAAEVQSALEPLAAGMRAKQQIAQRFPDYATAENEVLQYVGSNAELNARFTKMFASDPVGAGEWAYLTWREARGKRESAADESARVDAGLPGGAAARQVPTPSSEEEERKGLDYYRAFRDDAPYRRARLKGVIPDSHFEGP